MNACSSLLLAASLGTMVNAQVTMAELNEIPTLRCPTGDYLTTDWNKCEATLLQTDPFIITARSASTVICRDDYGSVLPIDQLDANAATEGNGLYDYYVLNGNLQMPMGNTRITCKAIEENENSATCNFFIHVRDNDAMPGNCMPSPEYDGEAPKLRCPPAKVEAVTDWNQCYADNVETVNGRSLEIISTDNEALKSVYCTNPRSGEDMKLIETEGGVFKIDPTYQFPIGTTQIECKTIDGSKNSASCDFAITVTNNNIKPGDCDEEEEKKEEMEVAEVSKEDIVEEESGCCLSQSGACPSGYFMNNALSQVVDLGKAVICNKSSNCKIGAITVGRSATTVAGVQSCPSDLPFPTTVEEIQAQIIEDEEAAEDAEEQEWADSMDNIEKYIIDEDGEEDKDDNSSAQRHLVGFGVALASFVATLVM